uniref:Uncharacterized protein n=1 Tax=Anguilla anguilla TaxID=7936 RepID=A0A0E9RZ15_ANGAN
MPGMRPGLQRAVRKARQRGAVQQLPDVPEEERAQQGTGGVLGPACARFANTHQHGRGCRKYSVQAGGQRVYGCYEAGGGGKGRTGAWAR